MSLSAAYLEVSADLLRDLLHLPIDVEIIASVDADAGIVRLLIDSPDIPRGAVQVKALYRSIHGVSVFDKFEVVICRMTEAA